MINHLKTQKSKVKKKYKLIVKELLNLSIGLPILRHIEYN